jgi:hypothetical protein
MIKKSKTIINKAVIPCHVSFAQIVYMMDKDLRNQA